MKNIKVIEGLNEEALLLAHQEFNKINNSQWTLTKFKQSLANQDYLNFLVFYQNNTIIGIAEYSLNNPWNKTIIDISYAINTDIKEYMLNYIKKIVNNFK